MKGKWVLFAFLAFMGLVAWVIFGSQLLVRRNYWVEAIKIPMGHTIAGVSLNNHGHLAISLRKKNQYMGAFLWESPTERVEICPGCRQIFVRDLNDRGEVIGNYLDDDWNRRPFYWSEETGVVDLEHPPLDESSGGREYVIPVAIDDRGEILANRYTVYLTEGRGRSNQEDGIGPDALLNHSPNGGFLRSESGGVSAWRKVSDFEGISVSDSGDVLIEDGTAVFLWRAGGDREEIVENPTPPRKVWTLCGFGEDEEIYLLKEGLDTKQFLFRWKGGILEHLEGFPNMGTFLLTRANSRGEVLIESMGFVSSPRPIRWLMSKGFQLSWLPASLRERLAGRPNYRSLLWSKGVKSEIEDEVALPRGVEWDRAEDLNDMGQIAARGTTGEGPVVLLLTPIDHID